MIPTLIVLALLALGIGIVAFATRRPATRQDVVVDQDTAWNDPIAPAAVALAGDAAFADAPAPTPPLTTGSAAADAIPAERPS